MASDPAPQDLNLTSPVYILWGIRPNNSTAGSIPAHAIALPSDIPAASATPANPSNGVVVSTPVSWVSVTVTHCNVLCIHRTIKLLCIR